MTEWRLKDCCYSISDGDHLPPPKSACGIPFITISNIDSTNHIDFENTLFVPIEYYNNLDSIRKPQVNDIIYSVVGSFGKPVLIKENRPFVFQRHIAILRPNNEIVDSRYLYYVMLSRDFYMQADSVALGAAQRTISLTSLRNMKVQLPDLDVQRRIAEVLSRYDALIENYQRQIKLLEEAAQRLYKEWFVDLRFPGHQSTPIINNFPQSWQSKPILEVFDFKYGKILPTKELIANGPIPVYGASKRIGYYDKANCFEAKVLVGSRGNAGHVHRTYEKVAYVTNNSFIISPQPGFIYIGLPYIYEAFRAIDFAAVCTGAAQPQLTLNTIASLQIILPSKPVVIEYIKLTEPIFERIDKAYNQIRNLSEARDRLLPRLMSVQ